MENVAVNSTEVLRVSDALQMVRKLVESEVRTIRSNHVPPRGGTDSGSTDVGCIEKVKECDIEAFLDEACRKLTSYSHVSEKQPSGNERFVGLARWSLHDVKIGRVEAQSSGGKTVSDQVHPQQLHWDERFRQTKSSSQENTTARQQQMNSKLPKSPPTLT